MTRQKTIKKDFFLEGKGLQTGKVVKAFFYPEDKNTGIVFVRRDLSHNSRIKLSDFLSFDTDRRSKIVKQDDSVETVEHVLAALWGMEIDNVRVELTSSEPPALDGSSKMFTDAIKNVGIELQNAERNFILIKEPIWVEEKEAFLGIFPSKTFKISYVLDYPIPSIGRQVFSEVINSEVFQKELAPARTFCLKEEVDALLKQGYGKGANTENTLVMDKAGPIDTVLRFPNEPVRHKVLDLVGDLYLLGKALKGRVIAVRSGHRLNIELVKRIKEYVCK